MQIYYSTTNPMVTKAFRITPRTTTGAPWYFGFAVSRFILICFYIFLRILGVCHGILCFVNGRSTITSDRKLLCWNTIILVLRSSLKFMNFECCLIDDLYCMWNLWPYIGNAMHLFFYCSN